MEQFTITRSNPPTPSNAVNVLDKWQHLQHNETFPHITASKFGIFLHRCKNTKGSDFPTFNNCISGVLFCWNSPLHMGEGPGSVYIYHKEFCYIDLNGAHWQRMKITFLGFLLNCVYLNMLLLFFLFNIFHRSFLKLFILFKEFWSAFECPKCSTLAEHPHCMVFLTI